MSRCFTCRLSGEYNCDHCEHCGSPTHKGEECPNYVTTLGGDDPEEPED